MFPAPTDREMAILKVLWELGEGSVRDVHERLVPDSGLHFNTIQTQMRIRLLLAPGFRSFLP